MNAPLLQLEQFSVLRGQCPVVAAVSYQLHTQRLIGLIGPNGAGKTSLLHGLAGELDSTGQLQVQGIDLRQRSTAERARHVALLTQQMAMPTSLTVREFVSLSQLADLRWWQQPDRYSTALHHALTQFELLELAERSCDALSGGEWQRCQLARLCAQNAPLWLLDEPINHLDIRHQHQIMLLLQQTPHTVIASLHDLNLAALYCDEIWLLADGQLQSYGPPAEVLTQQRIEHIFQWPCQVTINDEGRPTVRYQKHQDLPCDI